MFFLQLVKLYLTTVQKLVVIKYETPISMLLNQIIFKSMGSQAHRKVCCGGNDFSQSFQANGRKAPNPNHDGLPPHPPQFIIHHSPCHSSCRPRNWKRRRADRKKEARFVVLMAMIMNIALL